MYQSAYTVLGTKNSMSSDQRTVQYVKRNKLARGAQPVLYYHNPQRAGWRTWIAIPHLYVNIGQSIANDDNSFPRIITTIITDSQTSWT